MVYLARADCRTHIYVFYNKQLTDFARAANGSQQPSKLPGLVCDDPIRLWGDRGICRAVSVESLKCLCVRRLAVRCDGNDDRRPSRYHLLVICAAWCSFYGHCSRRCAKRVGGCFRAHRSSIPVYVPTSTPSAGLAGSNGDGSRWPRRSNRVVTASSLDFLRQR